jgi:hypothetical protein
MDHLTPQGKLRLRIRLQLMAGQLPPANKQAVFVGHGDGSLCTCCGRMISWGNVQYAVEISTFIPMVAMHVECHDIWREQSLGWIEQSSATPGSGGVRTERAAV